MPVKLKDGTLLYPVRGKAPEPIEGYEVDPHDPFVHRLILKPCEDREYLEPDCTSCSESTTMHCKKMENDETWKPYDHKQINRMDCKNCPFEDQPQNSSFVSVDNSQSLTSLEDTTIEEST